MPCVKPYRGLYPCGHCTYCRIQYSANWTIRALHELEYYNTADFVTLTYEIPPNGLQISDAQKFIKRLRKRIPTKIKYILCGEYGDKTKRPHYHAILFGVPPYDSRVDESWKLGILSHGTVTAYSIRYCTDYVLKKYNGTRAREEYGDLQPPFRLLSQGLGKRYALDHMDRLMRELSVVYRGKPRALPRYYRDVIRHNCADRRKVVDMLFALDYKALDYDAIDARKFEAWAVDHGYDLTDTSAWDYDILRYRWRKDNAANLDASLIARQDFYTKGQL